MLRDVLNPDLHLVFVFQNIETCYRSCMYVAKYSIIFLDLGIFISVPLTTKHVHLVLSRYKSRLLFVAS